MPCKECGGWLRAWLGTLLASLALAGIATEMAFTAERDTYQSARDAAAEAKAKARKESGSWWSRLWPFGNSKPEPKPEPKTTAKSTAKKTSEAPSKAKPVSAPLGMDGARLIADEQAKFLRRQEVCDRLREAAVVRGDAELEKQAQLLEQRAWFIYEQRTAQARVPSLLPIDDSLSAARLAAPKEAKDKETAVRKQPQEQIRSILARSPNGGED
ncbi:MAG: hypothetical protein NZM31_14470 [Gemmatales bacterium]|nr:hypothetical protein [Gemmatales bacterium]MDW8388200.1 hypothetical protein [Gemmatales bacterium]